MGVRQHNLILIGYDIGSEKYNDDEWENEESLYRKYDLNRNSEKGDIVLLSDSYSGKFFIAGKLVSVDYEGYNGFGMVIPDTETEEFKTGKQEVKVFIKEHFDLDVEPTYIVMTYYT